MRLRLLAATAAVAAAVAACGTDPTVGQPVADGSASGEVTSQIALAALQGTDGDPLIDPSELIDAASYDGIPAINEPFVIDRQRADEALVETEQVMLVEHAGQARAYPVRSLIRHEIANDIVGGLPVAVTWCPLCNTGITFDRRINGVAEQFGVSGALYRSALVMFDRRTQSLWPQPLGVAALGPLLGTELTVVASSLLPWKEVRDAYPDVDVVLGSEQELESTLNPYEGYDVSGLPFLFRGDADERLPAFVRVAGVSFSGVSQAWSYDVLRRKRTVDATVGGQPLVVLWAPGSASPLEKADVREGRDVGSTGVYDSRLDGRPLTFALGGGTYRLQGPGDGQSLDARRPGRRRSAGRTAADPPAPPGRLLVRLGRFPAGHQAREGLSSRNHFAPVRVRRCSCHRRWR